MDDIICAHYSLEHVRDDAGCRLEDVRGIVMRVGNALPLCMFSVLLRGGGELNRWYPSKGNCIDFV